MVVARACHANIRIRESSVGSVRLAAFRTAIYTVRCEGSRYLQRMRHIGVRQLVVAMASLAAHCQQPARTQLRQMSAGRLRRNISGEREFARRARAPIEQRDENRSARRIAK